MNSLSQSSSAIRLLPGILIAAAVAVLATILGGYYPLLGNLLFAILIGMLIRNTIGISPTIEHGINYTVKGFLKFAVILLGVGLNLHEIATVGKQSFFIIFTSVCLGIILTVLVGKMLKLDNTLSLLIGVGTSICGATAISAVKEVVKAKENETAYAISTIVLFNLFAFFTYPIIGQFFQLSETSFGIWAGTAVHDTSSAIAVGFLYGDQAGDTATTVKLARTLFLLPLLFLLPFIIKKSAKSKVNSSILKAFPWFILWFLLVSLLNTIGLIPEIVKIPLNDLSKFLITMVMAGVGMQVSLKELTKLGLKPLLTGLFASLCVGIISLIMILLFI